MSRFVVTGFPRSRTAWFAVATGAIHEPISHMGWDQWSEAWPADVGVSDAAAIFHLPEIIAGFWCPVLIVERPKADVLASFLAYLEPAKATSAHMAETCRAILDRYETHMRFEHALVRRVRYRDLENLATVEACMAHLGVRPVNLAQLMHMNIQSDLGFNLALLKEKVA